MGRDDGTRRLPKRFADGLDTNRSAGFEVTVTARFAAFNWYTSLDRSPDFSLGATLGSNFILDRECAGFPGDSMGLALLEMPRQALPLSGSVCTGTIQIGEHITT